ncbi:EpsG family protein [Escherichia albertii]
MGRFIIRLILLLPLSLLLYFPSEYNKDYSNYRIDYDYALGQFDYLYELFVAFSRDILKYDFSSFWIAVIVFELIILAIYYSKIKYIFISYPGIVSMSQFFYGTQIRYALAILIGLVFLKNNRYFIRFFGVLIAGLFHYGALISLFPLFVCRYLNEKYFIVLSKRNFILAIFVLVFLYFFFYSFETLVSMTRFSYYLGDEKFSDSKSLASIIYAVASLSCILILYAKNSTFRTDISKQSIVLLVLVLIFSPIAVLSGRTMIVYFVMEPLLIASAFDATKKNGIGCSISILLLLLYVTKCFYYMVTADFYFFDIL